MTVAVWISIGVLVAAGACRQKRFTFPLARSTTVVGGMAGGFLGGGLYSRVAGVPTSALHPPALSAALAGAILVVAAVGWAGHERAG